MTNKELLVSFGEVTIQSYPVHLGDNPACTRGAPIQLGWNPCSTEILDVETYELWRRRERKSSSSSKAAALPAEKRGKRLLQAGYTMEDIATAALQVDTIRGQRADTLAANQGWERLGSILVKTGKLPRGILKGFVSAGKALVKPVHQAARTA